MYDVAIAGGGLCGLAVAEAMAGQGLSIILIEARDRLGGRILTRTSQTTGLAVDLGAGWFWPHRQYLAHDLVKRLGLQGFAQYDRGQLVTLGDPAKGAQPAGSDPVHNGAFRVSGGTGAVVASLAERIEAKLCLGTRLVQVRDAGDHVVLRVVFANGEEDIAARQLVVAIPPRLVAGNVTFTPSLAPEIVSAMQQVPTWMATAAKAVQCYQAGGWRAAGLSGSAFVLNHQAVLNEVFDACDATGERAALGGFLALSPDLRQTFAAGLPMLIANQFAQIFGPEYEAGELHMHDWATEPLTCATADRTETMRDQPVPPDPLLCQPHWQGKLHFGCAETALRDPGTMEGALDAGQRIVIALRATALREAVATLPANRDAIARYATWVGAQLAPAKTLYEQRVTRRLVNQQRDQLTQMALLETVEAVFGAALEQLAQLDFDTRDVAVEKGRSALMPLVQAPFRALLSGLIEAAMRFNAGSCALSNFPGEHRPSREYQQAMLRDIAAMWTDFSQRANAVLLAAREDI